MNGSMLVVEAPSLAAAEALRGGQSLSPGRSVRRVRSASLGWTLGRPDAGG